MKPFTKRIALVLFSCLVTQSAWAARDVKEAMVKIYTVHNRYVYSVPWQVSYQEESTGSGCIIDGRRILTNAHVVTDRAFIQVRRSGMAKKHTAEVEIVAHECDLALLRVDDESFFSGVTPLKIGCLPEVRDNVTVYGFPKGGDKLSITEGVVSRVEHTRYTHSSAYLLTCQIDAAINLGNSGGPVIKDDKIVGVAFQAGSGQNIGYMVPAPIISRFLTDIKDGEYDGIPDLGISCQAMENRDIRHKFGMDETQTGVLVNKIYPDSPAKGILKSGDIILSVDGQDVENDGTIELRKGERTSWKYSIQTRHINDRVSLDILRACQTMDVELELSAPTIYRGLVPEQYDVVPTYYILGGLVFEPLTVNYLQKWGKQWRVKAPTNLLNYHLYVEPTDNRRQIIVLVRVLADEINTGYYRFNNTVVSTVNGREIADMKDLVDAIEEHEGRYHVITDERGHKIVLDKNKVSADRDKILEKYNIHSDRSKDLERFQQRYASEVH
jgi:S1-C subfamily serine protease